MARIDNRKLKLAWVKTTVYRSIYNTILIFEFGQPYLTNSSEVDQNGEATQSFDQL